MTDKDYLKKAIKQAKNYYEGFNNLEEINSKNLKQIELVYIPDFEEEILQIIKEWHN